MDLSDYKVEVSTRSKGHELHSNETSVRSRSVLLLPNQNHPDIVDTCMSAVQSIILQENQGESETL